MKDNQPKIQNIKLTEFLKLDKEDFIIQFMSNEIANEDCTNKVLKVAKEKVNYLK